MPALTGSQPSFYTDYVAGPGQPTFTAGNNSVPMQATPTAVSIVFAPFDTVRLGGSVTDTAGIPVEGVQVSFSGGGASTAADGSWSMYLVPNSGGMLTFMFPGQPFGVSDNYSIGTADRTIDLTEPTMTTAVFTVTDANANPLIGLTVHNGAGNANAPLSDGTILQAVYMPMNADATCTTDSAGSCTVPALTGSQPSFYTDYTPVQASNYPTFTAGNNSVRLGSAPNAVPIVFVNVGHTSSAGAVGGQVYASSPNGTTLSALASTAISNNTLPSGAVAVAGELGYQVRNVTPGGSIDVVLSLPSGSTPTGVVKFQNGAYVDLTSLATISGNIVTLHLTDGGPGDADATVNGVIFDPAIPVRRAKPTPPTGLTVSPRNNAIAVAWTPPLDDGGAPISAYVLTPYKGTSPLPAITVGGSVRSTVVPNLVNGSSYTVRITARNAGGTSAASVSTAVVAGTPAAVGAATGTPIDSGATLTWTAPSANGTAARTAILVVPYLGAAPVPGKAKTLAPTATTATFTGLTNGSAYSYRVFSRNAVGLGPAAIVGPLTAGSPAAPTGVRVVPSSTTTQTGALSIVFTGGSPNGSPTTGYTLTCTPVDGGPAVTRTAAASPVTIPGLATSHSYRCAVKAANARGSGPLTTATPVTVGAPQAPTSIAATAAGPHTIRVSFVPGGANGSPILAYTATCVSTNGGITRVKAGSRSPLVVTGLTSGKTYRCSVVATNTRGVGLVSGSSISVVVT